MRHQHTGLTALAGAMATLALGGAAHADAVEDFYRGKTLTMIVATTNAMAPRANGTAIQKCQTCCSANMAAILGPGGERAESRRGGHASRSSARAMRARSDSGTSSTQRLRTTRRSSASKS